MQHAWIFVAGMVIGGLLGAGGGLLVGGAAIHRRALRRGFGHLAHISRRRQLTVHDLFDAFDPHRVSGADPH
jgi:hypothetical protein